MADAITVLKGSITGCFRLIIAYRLRPAIFISIQFGVVPQNTFWLSCELIALLILVHSIQSRWDIGLVHRSAWWIRCRLSSAVLSIAFMGICWKARASFISILSA